MLNDVITGSIAELTGSLAVVGVLGLAARARRRRGGQRGTRPGTDASATRAARIYTLIGTRAPDGNAVQAASSRPAGTILTRKGPAGERHRRFELTDAILADGTYAAEPLDEYR